MNSIVNLYTCVLRTNYIVAYICNIKGFGTYIKIPKNLVLDINSTKVIVLRHKTAIFLSNFTRTSINPH